MAAQATQDVKTCISRVRKTARRVNLCFGKEKRIGTNWEHLRYRIEAIRPAARKAAVAPFQSSESRQLWIYLFPTYHVKQTHGYDENGHHSYAPAMRKWDQLV